MVIRSTSGAWWLRLSTIASLVFISTLGSPAGAQISFSDVSTAAGITSRSVSYGASWGDVNGDGHPDLFLNNHARKSSIYLNNGSGHYTDAIDSLDPEHYWTGTGATQDTHGAVWVDFDNDGDQDLVVSTGICCNIQFMVNQGGKLYNRTTQYGFLGDADQGGRMPIFFDFNKDGFLDVSLLTFYAAPLYKQAGGKFVDGKAGTGYTCNDDQFAVLIDLNGDGVLDLVCVHTGGPFAQAWDMSNMPWKNITSKLPATTNVNDVVIGDFDNNQRNDMLLLHGSLRPSQVVTFNGNQIEAQFINNDRGFSFKSAGVLQVQLDWSKTFVNNTNVYIGQNGAHPSSVNFTLDPNDASTHGLKPKNPSSTNGELHIGYDPATQTWTFNQFSGGKFIYTYIRLQSATAISGLVATGIQAVDGPQVPVLLSNLPTGMTDRTVASGLGAKINCVSGVAADFNNDMYQDIFLTCRNGVENIADILLMNDGHGNFTAVPNAGGAAGPIGVAVGQGAGVSETVVAADYDLDGRVDLLVTNGLNLRPQHLNNGPYQLFRNTSPVRNWIELDLVGTNSNRDAIGARIYATAGGVTQYREQNDGYHRWSQNQRRIHFGLADNTTVNIKVNWPSGHVDTYNGVAADHIYIATEAGGIQQAHY
jgi:hypothetical protein